jgi:DNA-binding beta-propeller fold protein YncE
MAFVITGSGTRTADAFEDGAAFAPLLHIEYTLDGGTPTGPRVSVSDGAPNPAVEAAGAAITFTFTLSATAPEDVILNYHTENGSATAGSDFTGVTQGQARIAAGSTSVTVPIALVNDSVAESAEAFALRLDSAQLATSGTAVTIVDGTGTGNIADSDGAPSQPRVVAIRDLRPVTTDPSGLAYVPALQTLFVSDSEVEETPYFRPNNLFALRTDGISTAAYSLLNFTDEPTGLAFDPTSGHMFICDDDAFTVFRVDPANPTVSLGEFLTRPLGATDPEDVAVNPHDGHVFIVNGSQEDPPNIVETTNTGTLVSSVPLPSVISDPEALAYDPNQDVFYVGGGFSYNIWRVDRSGQILETIDILKDYRNPIGDARVHVKDLEFAPSSDPNDDPGKLNLYLADFGNSTVDDGRLIEIELAASQIA